MGRPSSRSRTTLAVAVFVSAVLVAGCDGGMYRSNAAHTGESLGEKVIGVGNVATLSEAWTTSDDDPLGSSLGTPPIVAGGRLYVDTPNRHLSVYDARGIDNCGGSPKECQPVWKAQVGGPIPAVVGGRVYKATTDANGENGALAVFDAAGTTGCSGSPPACQPLWTAPLGAGTGYLAPPTVTGGIVYVAGVVFGSANVLFAFDALGRQGCTGTPTVCAPLWTATYGQPTAGDPAGHSPAVANGRVFVSGADYTVHVFDAAGQQNCDGTPKECSELWTAAVPPFDCGASSCPLSTPAIANGVLYVTGEARDGTGGLYAFDAGGTSSCGGSPKQCSPLWISKAGATTYPPAIANGVVYTVGYVASPFDSHRLRAFDAAGMRGCTGAPKICAPLWTSTMNGLARAPTIANGVVYAVGIADFSCDIFCTATRHLFAFDGSGVQGCTGTPKRCSPLLDVAGALDIRTFTDPVVANGVLYVGDDDLRSELGGNKVVHAFTP